MSMQQNQPIVPEVLLNRQELTRETLVSLIQVAEKNNMNIPWWEKYGQPAFDRVTAVFEGPAGNAGSVVQQVLAVKGLTAQVRLFPYGIPALTTVRIEIEGSGAAN